MVTSLIDAHTYTLRKSVTIMDECDETESTSSNTVLAPSSSMQVTRAELLWNQFIENLTKRPPCKYPNPEVPEFYPRNMKIVCAKVSHETGDSSANDETRPAACTTINTLQQNVDIVNITRVTQPTFVEAAESAHGIAHYYWTFNDPNQLLAFDRPTLKRIPRTIKFQEPVPGESEVASSSSSSGSSLQELQMELHTKNQQLVHMNNVVRALLEEIYRINELLIRNRVKEHQGTYDVHSFVKSASELGYPCDNCCTRLEEFVGHVSKQVERKMAKQHVQYRSGFVDCILSVIENSLRTLSLSHRSPMSDDEDTKKKLRKQDAYTQTNARFYCCEQPHPSRQQTTRVYRNRNLYRYETATAEDSEECPRRHNKVRRANNGSSFWRRKRPAPPQTSSSSSSLLMDSENPKNLVQLVHQRFKNLNCRLEGIPDKKMVKFSYIVDDKEYSAIAATKKEAQYLCAWNMLNSCKE